MAQGAGLGGAVTALLPLVGLVTILMARRRRKTGRPAPADAESERRQAATLETERRMAAYLASRDNDGSKGM